ncbi:MAG: hypothetical protein WAO19_02915 [Candidatus Kryptoniota bacterium]
MAELTKAVLGRFSGRIGDTVFRQRNGKNFVGTRPGRYAPPDDQGVDRPKGPFQVLGQARSGDLFRPRACRILAAPDTKRDDNVQFHGTGKHPDREPKLGLRPYDDSP